MTHALDRLAGAAGLRPPELFADGADLPTIERLAADPSIDGFTTNPTLLAKAGVTDYEAFARAALEVVGDRPISFEVFADDPTEIARQARLLAGWGDQVFVKVPVMTTDGISTHEVVAELASDGVRLNVTALMTPRQVAVVSAALAGGPPSYISVFAGRVADAGLDPVPIMAASVAIMAAETDQRLIWASPREAYNYVQAAQVGCHVITMTADLLAKLPTIGKDLDEFSLDTVAMFRNDAVSSGYTL
ncbi:MAG: transaldolase [Microthrixaceae bacterium]|nr:transaldolase [Microthrixaceae bacterium]